MFSRIKNPAVAIIRSRVAWMAGRREADCLKPIDKAFFGNVSESSGRNESERTGGLESAQFIGRARSTGVKAAWMIEN